MSTDIFEKLAFGDPRESNIEGDAIAFAEAHGWWVSKFTGKAGVPDRLFIRDGRHVFIEFKKFKKKPKRHQSVIHKEMRDHGAEVYVVDNLKQAYDILR